MLVLSRKPEQTISIGGDITVALFGIDREGAKIGINAPDDVHILREELVGIEDKPHAHKKSEGSLVLHRKVGEGIAIGENIIVKVLGIGRNHVKIGTEAPLDIRIERGELINEGSARRSKEAF